MTNPILDAIRNDRNIAQGFKDGLPIAATPARTFPTLTAARRQLAERITALCAIGGDMPMHPAPGDFTDLAIWCEGVLGAVRGALLQTVDIAEYNEPGSQIRDAELARSIESGMSDLQGDLTGTLDKVADRMRGEQYGGAARGPMHRVRA